MFGAFLELFACLCGAGIHAATTTPHTSRQQQYLAAHGYNPKRQYEIESMIRNPAKKQELEKLVGFEFDPSDPEDISKILYKVAYDEGWMPCNFDYLYQSKSYLEAIGVSKNSVAWKNAK